MTNSMCSKEVLQVESGVHGFIKIAIRIGLDMLEGSEAFMPP